MDKQLMIAVFIFRDSSFPLFVLDFRTSCPLGKNKTTATYAELYGKRCPIGEREFAKLHGTGTVRDRRTQPEAMSFTETARLRG
jgi:hypothetical protein